MVQEISEKFWQAEARAEEDINQFAELTGDTKSVKLVVLQGNVSN
jgi:hypothetical protein